MRQLKITKKITQKEGGLDKYLNEIGKVTLLSPEEEVSLAKKIKKGDKVALDKMVRSNLRFVVSVAKQYQNQGLPLPDLISAGNLGLIKAAERFDETRGFKFISYAVWWIRQFILQTLAENSRIVRLPLNIVGQVNRLNKAYSNLEQELQREPTREEISKRLELSVSEIDSIVGLGSRRHISFDAQVTDNENSLVIDTFVDEDSPCPEESSIYESMKRDVLRVLATLTTREAEIIKLYFGIDCQEMTLEEIGMHYGLTRERARQIKEKAVRRMRHTTRSGVLKGYLGK